LGEHGAVALDDSADHLHRVEATVELLLALGLLLVPVLERVDLDAIPLVHERCDQAGGKRAHLLGLILHELDHAVDDALVFRLLEQPQEDLDDLGHAGLQDVHALLLLDVVAQGDGGLHADALVGVVQVGQEVVEHGLEVAAHLEGEFEHLALEKHEGVAQDGQTAEFLLHEADDHLLHVLQYERLLAEPVPQALQQLHEGLLQLRVLVPTVLLLLAQRKFGVHYVHDLLQHLA